MPVVAEFKLMILSADVAEVQCLRLLFRFNTEGDAVFFALIDHDILETSCL